MFNFKSKLFIAGATLALTGVVAVSNPTEASAAEYDTTTWEARSVDDIKQDLQNNEDGSTEYTIQWGDTLSSVAAATDTSLNALIDVNDINNANIIYSGNVISLSADHSTVTIEKEDEVVSYDVTQAEEAVETEAPAEEAQAPVEETEAAAPVEQQPEETQATEPAAQSGQSVTVQATAYSTNQPELSDTTATGINLKENPNVIAVDPSVIPLGSTVTIPGYGTFIAGDTGSAIQGNRIDIHMTDLNQALSFGRQTLTVQVSN